MIRRFPVLATSVAVIIGVQVLLVGWELGGIELADRISRTVAPASAFLAFVACAIAAVRRNAGPRRGWALFSAAAFCWFLADAGLVADHLRSEGPVAKLSAGDVPSAAAIVFAALAVLAFLRPALSSAARMRTLFDGLIAASSMLFLSWATVLDDLYRGVAGGPARAAALTYPVGDLVIISLLVVGAARVRRGGRLPWTLLCTGLALITIGDSAFAYLHLADAVGIGGLNGIAWSAGCLLIGLAALAPGSEAWLVSQEPRPAGSAGIWLPYVPVSFAMGLAASRQVNEGLGLFLTVNAGVIVVLLIVRQLLAQFENLELARGLDAKVQARTADLARQEQQFRSLVQNASDVLTVLDADLVVRYQSESVTRCLGYRSDELNGTPLGAIVHDDDRETVLLRLRSAGAPPGPPVIVEARMRRCDGSFCLTETRASNLLEDEGVRGMLLTTRDITDRRILEDQLRHRAFHDPLTNLGNRVLFKDRLEHAVARNSRHPEALAVLMLDLDGFKKVNDTLGHAAGDFLLQEVAERLRNSVRPGDTVARMGGDEFAILVERATAEVPTVVAQRILNRLRAPLTIDGKELVPNGSIGVAMNLTTAMDAEELLRQADLAMYMAKQRGKGTYEVFESDMHTSLMNRVELEGELRRAIREGELRLHYQPIVEIPSGRIAGVEALVRWEHPQKGLVPPGDFIPVAEESELIVDLGRWVFQEACRQATVWQEAFPTEPPFTVSVNVAARQLASPWLVKEVRRALIATGALPSSLVLEITEGALMSDPRAILPTLEELKSLGVQLAIDDFGTGWSSLSRLRSFPVDKLKVDRSFVAEIDAATDEAPLVAAVVAMAHSLGLGVVAEGVETIEQLACLHQLGCEEVQGFLLARPMPVDALERLLADPVGLLYGPDGIGASAPPEPSEFINVVSEVASHSGASGPALLATVLGELQRVAGVDAVYLTRIEGKDERISEVCTAEDMEIAVGLRWEELAQVRLGSTGHAWAPVLAPGGAMIGRLGMANANATAPGSGDVVLLELFATLVAEHLATSGWPTAAPSEPITA